MKTSWQPLRTFFHIVKVEGHKIAAFIFALLIASLCLVSSINAQTTAKQQADNSAQQKETVRGNSTMRGRVFDSATGRTLPRAHVLVFDLSATERQHVLVTDERGEFSLKNLVAGTYGITVKEPGIIDPLLNLLDPHADLTTVSVDGMNNVEVDVRALRGGVISGRVTRAGGEAATGATIALLREKKGRMFPYRVGGAQTKTDRRGIYRISGLPSGEYFVSAAEENTIQVTVEQKGEEVAYNSDYGSLKGTFYQATTDIRNATPVHVEAGTESGNINITLVERSTHVLSGKVLAGRTGRPAGRARVVIQNKDASGKILTGRQVTEVDAQGNWSFREVPDGTYLVTIVPLPDPVLDSNDGKGHGANYDRALRRFTHRRQEVTIAGADLTGVVIEVYQGASIYGTVTVDGDKPLPTEMYVHYWAGAFVPARVEADGTFALNGVPAGNVYLDAYSWPEGKFYVKSINAQGQDLLREPLKAEEGAEIKDVRIVISPEVAMLTGRALSAQGGAPLGGVNVVLVPVEPARQRVSTARPFGITNDDGAFKITGAPGEYLLMIWKRGDPKINEEFIKTRAAHAPRVTLASGESKSMDITWPEGK